MICREKRDQTIEKFVLSTKIIMLILPLQRAFETLFGGQLNYVVNPVRKPNHPLIPPTVSTLQLFRDFPAFFICRTIDRQISGC